MKTDVERRTARYLVRGAVQGVGFRPSVCRLARALGLGGSVRNAPHGAIIEAAGSPEALRDFESALRHDLPPPAHVDELILLERPVVPGDGAFTIVDSDEGEAPTAAILPDLATCPACLRDILDPANRRHRYPFTNCTRCGPRFSIITGLPYDRPRTTMAGFTMCPACRAEYENPADRRFHAQPNACPDCGPQLALWDDQGFAAAERDDALLSAADAIRRGETVALKGIGGFMLVVDGRNDEAVLRLRERKRREEKPFATMFPDLESLRAAACVGEEEALLLTSAAAPIVLLRRRPDSATGLAPGVAPGSAKLGAMLPYSPLHHLLMRELGFPVVATSGNLRDEPICIDERHALGRLHGVADRFLVHNRPIARPVDDSVARVVDGRAMVLRRARGFAPAPVTLPAPRRAGASLALGAHLKSTVAIRIDRDVFVSQHLGDLETEAAFAAFKEGIGALRQLYPQAPREVLCDLHPDYLSSRHAATLGVPVIRVQHHAAHVAACMAENDLEGPVLGIAWDGTGYGTDGSVWGGEFFRASRAEFARIGHLRAFRLPGGEQAIREPRRAALGLLFAARGADALHDTSLAPVRDFTQGERDVFAMMLSKGVGSPMTSSAGRLFDAVASLLGVRQVNTFEGQAAMELEDRAGTASGDHAYPFDIEEISGKLVFDWRPLLESILMDSKQGRRDNEISLFFHNTMANVIVSMARRTGLRDIVLSGGCFQNALLAESALCRLRAAGFRPHRHRAIPPNDGGISYGQAVWAAWGTGLRT